MSHRGNAMGWDLSGPFALPSVQTQERSGLRHTAVLCGTAE